MDRRTATWYVIGFVVGAAGVLGVVAMEPAFLDTVPASLFLVVAGLLSLVALSGDGCDDCDSARE